MLSPRRAARETSARPAGRGQSVINILAWYVSALTFDPGCHCSSTGRCRASAWVVLSPMVTQRSLRAVHKGIWPQPLGYVRSRLSWQLMAANRVLNVSKTVQHASDARNTYDSSVHVLCTPLHVHHTCARCSVRALLLPHSGDALFADMHCDCDVKANGRIPQVQRPAAVPHTWQPVCVCLGAL